MSNIDTDIQKFQKLLEEIFQFDKSDLDFGIYRIMKYKRQQIRDFIDKGIISKISDEIEEQKIRTLATKKQELEETVKGIKEAIGLDAFDEKGQLKLEHHKTTIGKKWVELSQMTAGAKDIDELTRNAYVHLYNFFSRYYDEGDFISKRRYGRTSRYSIPYNGEEVLLHWANKDQYYIKTTENFTTYEFTGGLDGKIKVKFEVLNADIEQDNKKNDSKYFFPLSNKITTKGNELILPFHYRSLSANEKDVYGKNGNSIQNKIIEDGIADIQKQSLDTSVKKALLDVTDNKSLLETHLYRYVKKNTSDYFIHKNLNQFLHQELDFYLKNEFLNAEDLAEHGTILAAEIFVLFGVIRRIAHTIIDFLSQIEEFQKMLWEKRKFILETNYCVALHQIRDEDIIKDIADNEEQWSDWEKLNMLGDEYSEIQQESKKTDTRITYLKKHGSLVIDTRYFDGDFKDKLMASFADIDDLCGGVLINGENFQGLNLLQQRYSQQVKLIHIDPPYNTSSSGFLYKNNYQHSSWLSMMFDRFVMSINLLDKNCGCLQCHIDENEYESLTFLINLFNLYDQGTIIWDKRNPLGGSSKIATQHEYIICKSLGRIKLRKRKESAEAILSYAKKLIKEKGVTYKVKEEFKKWVKNNNKISNGETPFCELDANGRVYRVTHMGAPEQREDSKYFQPLIHPVTKKECPIPGRGWSNTPEFMEGLIKDKLIHWGADEKTQPGRISYLEDVQVGELSSIIPDGSKGKQQLDDMGLVFDYSHPTSLYEKLIFSVPTDNGYFLDYFAGSGTTGHAVIKLNREDGQNRKFILMEVNDYFDAALLPRIKKTIYAPEWKDGKPKKIATNTERERAPKLIKYHRIESYEDSLDNIRFEYDKNQMELKYDDYIPKYVLKWESQKSETLLATDKLKNPFNYTLRLTGKDSSQPKEHKVDLPETFNYLIGMHINTRKVKLDGKKRYLIYRGQIMDKDAVIIWRDTCEWKEQELEKDKDFINNEILSGENPHTIYVNDDSFVQGAQSLDSVFKKRMFAQINS